MAEPCKRPFGTQNRVGPSNHVLRVIQIPIKGNNFWGREHLPEILKVYKFCTEEYAESEKDHIFINITTYQEDWELFLFQSHTSHILVVRYLNYRCSFYIESSYMLMFSLVHIFLIMQLALQSPSINSSGVSMLNKGLIYCKESTHL